ncbi:MAG: protein kinase [Pyrinomonadaceae bacterium]|nr:protein kinase [Pyrinomonadaceae bacterium]
MLPKDHTLNQGRYRVINQIGQDETGAVYECFDENVKTKVLLKEISFSSKKVIPAGELEKLRENFTSKARKLLELNHESLLRVSDFFSEIDRFYLVMEFAEGNNLNRILEKAKCSFALSNVLNWADQLLFALNYLHTQPKPLFHNAVKPQTLRLTTEGKLRIFPICISANTDLGNGSASSNDAIDSACISYLPLEQIWDRLDSASQTVISKSYDEKSERVLLMPPDARSDIYALGATLYHLATGQAPIDALTRSIDLLEGKADPLPSLCKLNPAVPHEVSDVLMKALEIRREDRFDSAVIMRQVLRTSLLRARERQASEPKKVAVVQKETIAETKNLPAENVAVKAENPVSPKPPTETVSPSEIELMKQRLREAEEERRKAEQRAAEAEKLLLAQQALQNAEKVQDSPRTSETAEVIHESFEIIEDKEEILSAEIIYEAEPETQVEIEETPVAKVSQSVSNVESDEFSTLFAQPEPKSGVMTKVAGVGLVLALLGGGAWGYMNYFAPKNAETNQSATTGAVQTSSVQTPSQTAVNEKPAADNLPAPAVSPTVEAAPQTVADTMPPTAETSDPTKTAKQPDPKESKPASKPKPAVPAVADKEKKPSLASSKAPEPKKKPVTMDDLLNEN